MVVKHLIPDSDVATYLADTFSDIEQNITLPPLKIYNGSYSADIAAIQANSLDLAKLLNNVKEDTVSFRHLSEKLYHTSTLPQPTPSTKYIVYGLILITAS